MKKKFMIVGGNFVNKGAQAMTFVTVCELRKRFPECIIHMYSELDYRIDQSNLTFQIYDDSFFNMSVIKKVRYFCLAFAKFLLLHPKEIRSFVAYNINKRKYDSVIDISGFGLCSNDDYKFTEKFCKPIELARDNGIHVFLMAQSFGPLDFSQEHSKKIKGLLEYCTRIYAREKQGYDLLIQKYQLENVELAYDIVLQSERVNFNSIFKKQFENSENSIDYKESVAIVPNMQNFYNVDDENLTLQIYLEMVNKLLNMNKKVYLLRHSHEDILACRKIKEYFKEDEVCLIEKDMSCLEYEQVVSGFDFIIASRFHSVVHAYKEGVPCIILGWADKYEELAKVFGQERYVFDIRKEVNKESVDVSLDYMNENCKKEKEKIGDILKTVQKESPFDYIADYLSS